MTVAFSAVDSLGRREAKGCVVQCQLVMLASISQ